MSAPYRVVIDTNVFISALRSKRGSSHKLLLQIDSGAVQLCISVPLILEYEAVARELRWPGKPPAASIDDIIDYLCSIGEAVRPPYLWRPIAKDPKDEMLVELAVAGECDRIITYNKRDLKGVEKLGIKLRTPFEFLKELENVP